MRMKSDMTPLSDTDLLPNDSRTSLARYAITTVEELVGAIASDPDAVQSLLLIDGDSLQGLQDEAEKLLDAGAATKMSKPVERRATGALPPAKYKT